MKVGGRAGEQCVNIHSPCLLHCPLCLLHPLLSNVTFRPLSFLSLSPLLPSTFPPPLSFSSRKSDLSIHFLSNVRFAYSHKRDKVPMSLCKERRSAERRGEERPPDKHGRGHHNHLCSPQRTTQKGREAGGAEEAYSFSYFAPVLTGRRRKVQADLLAF